MLKKVILCPNPYRDHELTVAREAKRILDSVHCPNVVCVPFRNEEKPEGYGLDIRPLQQELRGADMIIAFGGDGTILHLSKTAAHRDIPVLGVNLGSLGFMAELEQKELGRLGELMDEKYTVESRMMLDVSVVREGRVIYSNLALNEAVVTRGAVSRVIRLHIRTEQGRLLDVTGDGVIVASPTGFHGLFALRGRAGRRADSTQPHRQSDLRAQRARQLLCALAGAHRHRADGKDRLQADLSLRRRRAGVLAAQRRRRGDPALKI